jgi:hypothetical protein
VAIEEIRNAHIQKIYIIAVERKKVQEIDSETYLKRAIHKGMPTTAYHLKSRSIKV